MVFDIDDNSILYYKVPVLDSDSCCYCGQPLNIKRGSYFFFYENYAGKIEVALHYCDRCNIGFRKYQELSEDTKRIHFTVNHDIRIETVEDFSAHRSLQVKHMIEPSRANSIYDRLLMEAEDKYTLLRLAEQLSEGDPTYEEFSVALRTFCKFGQFSKARTIIKAKEAKLNVSQIDEYYSFVDKILRNKTLNTVGERIPLSESDQKIIDTANTVKISSATLKSAPIKNLYIQNQELDLSGCYLNITYEDGNTEDIEVQHQMVSGYSSSIIGKQTVTIQYVGNKFTFDVTVEERSTVALSIRKPPNRIEYIEGNILDLTGLVLVASYNDGSECVITDYHCDKTKALGLCDDNATFSYDGYSVRQPISVHPKELEEIVIFTAPTQIEYFEGRTFNPNGMSVIARYNNGETQQVTDYQLIPNGKLSITDDHVTIIHHGLCAEQKIKVLARMPKNISIIKSPDKTRFMEGELFDASGMLVEAIYNDETKEFVEDYTLNLDRQLTCEDNIVLIEYRGLSAEQSIKVFAGADLSRFCPYIMA